MFKSSNQMTLDFSPYSALYDILIPKDSFWRKLQEEIDFNFVPETLAKNYTIDFGRPGVDPVFMFKLLLLKTAFELSDRGLIDQVRVNMEMKYFLGLSPEEVNIVDPSLLSKFRSQRMKDPELLDQLIQRTVEYAIEKNVITRRQSMIVDSTHTNARFQHISPREEIIRRCKKLRKAAYSVDKSLHDKMPEKSKMNTGILEDAMDYSQNVIRVIEQNEAAASHPSVQESLNYLKEALNDTENELEYSKDQDAKVGHKTADNSFFGYKTHIAMTQDRIITAATVTSGEKHDGKQLQELVEKTQKAGIEVEAVIGDGAYAEKDNLEYGKENGIKIAAKLSENVLHGSRKDEFEFNKDAGMYVCPAGHMAVRKARQGQKKSKNGSNTQVTTYFFDVERCKHCPLRNGCYKEGAKSKSYSVKIKDDLHTEQMDYMKTDDYKERMAHRYKIEAKNAELKQNYGFGQASAAGITGMTIQAGGTIFLANMKRIFKLQEKPREECAQNSASKPEKANRKG